jgi:enoyl-CoA hydratase/carnithine racemase
MFDPIQQRSLKSIRLSNMAFQELLYEVRDRVATVTFNRPDRLNAWTPTLEMELREAVAAATSDDKVRSVVLTGAGRGFCAGADMSRLAASIEDKREGSIPRPSSADDLGQRYSYLLALPKPLIAGINGPVAGVGVCIALYCDIRFMVAGAKLTTPYARRGLIAEHGIAWMLPRLIGPMHAADLLLSGRTVQAEEAAQMGLVKLLKADGFADEVHARASELANLCSPRALRVIKHQLFMATRQTLAQATQLADIELERCRDSADFHEGVVHFIEKRPPQFTGN